MPFTNKISIGADELLRQTRLTAGSYLNFAIAEIDERFGTGYAEQNPVLVASFIQACATDFAASIISQTLQESAEYIGQSIRPDEA